MQHDKNQIEKFKQMYRLVDSVGDDVAGDTGAAMEAYANFYTKLLTSSDPAKKDPCTECGEPSKNKDCWYCCPLPSDATEESSDGQ